MHNLFKSLLCLVPLAGLACGTKSYSDPSEFEGRGRFAPMARAGAAGSEASSAATGSGTAAAAPADAPPAPASPLVLPESAPARPASATQPAEARQVIYSAAFRVVVADVAGTLASLRETATRLGGHMHSVAGGSITFRVPAARFDEAVAYVERSGEVVDRQLKAQDVTEEMRDLHIRLDNGEKLRQRLLEILNKTTKVEDALKVEAELARVSEQIDAAKGRIRYYESLVAMSTIRVELNAAVAQTTGPDAGPRLPFSWVDDLGEGLVAGKVRQTVRRVGLFGRGPRFAAPAGFVKYFEDRRHAAAMDAGGLLARAERHANVDKAPLSFWSQLVRRALVEGRSLAVDDEQTTSGGNVYLLRGRRDVGGKPTGYLLSLERSDKGVIVFEAWGPLEQFEKSEDALRASALSIEPG